MVPQKEIFNILKEKEVEIYDATCVFVTQISKNSCRNGKKKGMIYYL